MSSRENQNWDRNRFERQRDLALQAHDAIRLGRVYLTATQSAPAEERVALLRQAVGELQPLNDSEMTQLDVEIELVRLDASDTALHDRVIAKLRAYDRHKDLCGLLEALLAPGSALGADAQLRRRAELFDLYRKQNDRGRSAEHLVYLLQVPNLNPEWLEQAEELLQNRAWLKLLGPSLAHAYERSNQPTAELSVLNRELEVARGPRLTELRKRLAVLRQDLLDDPEGALEILEPLVSADPSDDEIRTRFLDVSIQSDREQEAARRLTRAMGSVNDPAARARIGLDLGRLWQTGNDSQAAQSAYVDVLRTRANDHSVLAAAEALDSLNLPLDREAARDRLWALCTLSQEPSARRGAAEALLELCENEQAVDDLRATALEALVDTAPEGALDSLLTLESLYSERRDFQRLVPTLERILDAEANAEVSHRSLLAAQRAERLARLGCLRRDIMDDVSGALAAFSESLSINPHQALSLDALMEWMNNGPCRLEAAAILEPHLRAQGSHVELLVALGARTEHAASPEQRLQAAVEARALFEQGVVPTDSAAWFCAHGLKAALDSGSDEQVTPWAEALEKACVGNPSVEADGLETALGDRALTNAALFGLAMRSLFRLVEAQRFEQASARLAAAQRFDPTDPHLLALADVIGQVQGDEPEERLQRVEAAIEAETGARRVALLTVRASVERSIFGIGERELATWMQVIEADPRSAAAHEAVCEIYEQLGKVEMIEPELRRALASLPSDERHPVLARLAALLATQNRTREALELYREVLNAERPDNVSLTHAARLAEEAGDLELRGQVLQRAVDIAPTRVQYAEALDALGTHHLDAQQTAKAVESYRRALRVYVDENQNGAARALAERLLALAPSDTDTAAILVRLAFSAGDLRAAQTHFGLLAQADAPRAQTLLQELEPAAMRAGLPTADLQRARRWLLECRASAAPNASRPLLQWARAEADEFDDTPSAIALCERALELDNANVEALELLAELRLRAGAPEGALQALEAQRRYVAGSQADAVELRIAEVLAEHLEQPELAFNKLRSLIVQKPDSDAPIRMVARLSKDDRLGPSAAQLFAELASSWKSLGVPPRRVVDYIQPVARCASPDSVLWGLLEEYASLTESADQVVAAYTAAIAFFNDPETLERLGQRMVAFAEQWSPDASAFTGALLHILEIAPRARWALDRITFVLTQQGRFGELLDWFDRAIAAEESAETRHALLDEAIVTARDLAKDNERAIAYLERQCNERPDDAKAQASLERLYRRGGYTRKLIDLLTRRLESLADPERAQVQAHIATRWLELGEPDQALEIAASILERQPADSSALELLERIVDDGSPDESTPSTAQVKAAKHLFGHYMTLEQHHEAVRVLDAELRLPLDRAERVAVLHTLADLRINQLNDSAGAFRVLVELVTLEPTHTRSRLELEELAERLSLHREHAEALVQVALDTNDRKISLPLLTDALRVYSSKLDDPGREAHLHEQLLTWTEDPEVARKTLSALEGLYSKLDDPVNLCRVLELRAEREHDADQRLHAWRGAARLAHTALGDAQRAAAAWRRVLSFAPKDREALDGLVESLHQLEDSPALVDALETRAAHGESQLARGDLVRAATLAETLGHTSRALALWQRVANRFGDDEESALAIADLLEKEERWLELRDHLHEYSLSIDEAARRAILIRAARVELEKMNDTAAAISSYAKAQLWQEALSVVENTLEVAERASVALGLIGLAEAAWKAGDDQAEPICFHATVLHARCTLPAIGSMRAATADLAETTKLLRHATQVRDRLVAASQRPHARERRRALLLEAARVTSSWLREPTEAARLFSALFNEDPIDAVAEQSFGEYAELLQSQQRWDELAELIEHRAKAAPDGSPRAISAWIKAGDLWENEANDPARALAAYRFAADSDSLAALEAQARLARRLDHAAEAARALERLVTHAGSGAPIERVIELVDAYLASGDLGRARLRLESTLQAAWHPEIDRRLENLYRRIQQWSELVNLLKLRAERAPDVPARIELLREAATLQKTRLSDHTGAATTLASALNLDPDRSDLRLELALTCAAAGQYERAVSLLQELIEAFGPRRSRTRAELHTELSSVLEAMGESQRAFEELKLAASIDQAQPRILYSLGKSALANKAYDLAEQTLSSLLLLLHRSGGESQGVSQSHAYLVLAEVSTQRGDPVRARDYVESAFETALESPEHERRLLAALIELEKPALIQRAIELRWSHVTDPVARCALLSDRLSIATTPQERQPSKDRVERRARETWARLDESTPAEAFRNLAEVFDWLGDKAAAKQALNTFAERVDWAKATPKDATALLHLSQRELSEGSDLGAAHRHMEASLRLGISMPELAGTVDLVLSIADTLSAPEERRVPALEIARSLVEAVAVTAPAADPALGANLLLKLASLAESLGFGDVIDRAVAAAVGLDPNRHVLLAQLKRLRIRKPDSPERWELAEQLLAVEAGESALELGLEIAKHAREHQERARAARALSKVIGYVQSGAGLALDVVELLAWSGLPQRAMDLIEASPNTWVTDHEVVTKVTHAISDGVRNLELDDRLLVELRWIDWLITQDQLTAAQERLAALAAVMSNSPLVLERLARLAEQRGHADEAIKARQQLLNISSHDDKVARVCELYDTCDRLDRPGVARAELEQAHRACSTNREIARRLTRLYERLGAHNELSQLLLSDPSASGNDEATANNLVRAARLILAETPERAREFLQRAEQIRPNAPAELELARLHASSGEFDTAVEYYTLAAGNGDPRFTQERSTAVFELGQLHLGVDQLVEAHEALSAAFRFRPKNAGLALQVAQLAIDLSDDEVAKRALRVLVSLKNGPEDSDDSVSSQTKSKAFYYLGAMLNRQGDAAGARRMLSRALEEDATNESARLLHNRLA